ncbi:MAG TPA: glycosyltransferase family 9 protein [Hyphomicrobiaceae bacterium]|nr:glycosyltransferase family 9 protein [Hyphomicrobiaceae bacterium]
MKILIVKHGALGDVVRTSYFAGPLRRKYGRALNLSWITAPGAVPLICRNPHIDRVLTSFDDLIGEPFDIVYSLDDEEEIVAGVSRLTCARIVGVYLDDGQVKYSQDAAAWFDMGLRSRFGKARADELKKLNARTHGEIFAEMFAVDAAEAAFHGDDELQASYRRWLGDRRPAVGLNPFAGGRWPAKELRGREIEALIRSLLASDGLLAESGSIVLIGAGPDRDRNLALAATLADPRVRVADTEASPLHLAALIRGLDYMVSSDSLAMHLALAQGVPTVAFFAPTSAAEIDGFGRLVKVVSTAADYCSYAKDADNSTITHDRLLRALALLQQRRST